MPDNPQRSTAPSGLRVFLSHSADSADLANRLRGFLEDNRCQAIARPRELPLGALWRDALLKSVASADRFVLIIDHSPSDVERFEWRTALQASWSADDKWIVPVFMGGVEAPAFLRDSSGIWAGKLESSESELFPQVLRLLIDGPISHAHARKELHGKLLERLDVAIDAISEEETEESSLREHKEFLEKNLEAMEDPAAVAMRQLGVGLIDLRLRDPASACERLKMALNLHNSADAPPYPSRVSILLPLASGLTELGEFDAATDCLREAIDLRIAHEGSTSAGVIATSQQLGVALLHGGRDDEARKVLTRTLAANRQQLGPEHPRVEANEFWLATACERLGDYAEAKDLYEKVALVDNEKKETDPAKRVRHMLGLGRTLTKLDEADSAVEILSLAEKLAESSPAVSMSVVAACSFARGMALVEKSNWEQAIAAFQKAVELNGNAVNHEAYASSLYWLGVALYSGKVLAQAKEVLSEALSETKRLYGKGNRRVAEVAFHLGLVLQDEDDFEGAKEQFENAVHIAMRTVGSSDPRVLKYQRALDGLATADNS